jgi:hypothetical protein
VDGGGGVDTLKLDGAGLTLDLTNISNTRIQDIEIIDIRGSGDNTLKLNLNDLRARLPAPVCSNAVILLALMMMSSLPKPALNTSIPPSNRGICYQW